jgi:hypothetical protein
MAKSIALSFRVPVERAVPILRLRDTFPERTWRASFGWLLDQPEVQRIIDARLAEEGARTPPG